MSKRKVLSNAGLACLLALSGACMAQSSVEEEVRQALLDDNQYTVENLKGRGDGYSKDGALEFWSSGGLMQQVDNTGRPESFDAFNVDLKHIEVIPLPGGNSAVAMYYSEGSMKPAGSAAVPHYLTRVTQVLVKEDGEWKVRASHWSPVTGGSGTSQTAMEE